MLLVIWKFCGKNFEERNEFRVNTPQPGIYEDVPAEEYFSWDAVSNSRLSLLHKSPMHFQHGFQESTPAMQFGTLCHAGVLEPESIKSRYKVMPNYALDPGNRTEKYESSTSRATKYVRQREADFREDFSDFEIVDQSRYDEMSQIVSGLTAHPLAKKLFRKGQTELSLVWEDKSGFVCKCRIDWMTTKIFADLKITADVVNFERSIAKFGYHRQMAFYLRGLQAVGLEDREPWIVAADKCLPVGIRCAPISEDALVIGRREIDRLLKRLAECQESGEWPGYESPRAWNLPHWYSESSAVELVINGEQVSV